LSLSPSDFPNDPSRCLKRSGCVEGFPERPEEESFWAIDKFIRESDAEQAAALRISAAAAFVNR